MTAANFDPIMTAIYTLEGGFSNDPRDPGGMTDLGVTARELAAYLKIPLSSITEFDMKALTRDKTDPIYRANYWNVINGDMLPSGIDAMLMHMEVNAGGCAVLELQSIVGCITKDGIMGPKTLQMVDLYISMLGVGKLIDAIAIAQMAHYQTLKNFDIYGTGWTKRVAAMETLAENLALVK